MGAAPKLAPKPDSNARTSAKDKERRKRRALLILTGLVFAGIFLLLGIHAILTGQGSLLWDLMLGVFAGLSTVAMFSGVVFPFMALLIIPALPVVMFWVIWKNIKR